MTARPPRQQGGGGGGAALQFGLVRKKGGAECAPCNQSHFGGGFIVRVIIEQQ